MKARIVALVLGALALGRCEVLAQCSGCPNASFGRVPRDWPAILNPNSMATADFDGDGRLDLLVTSNSNGAVLLRGLPGGHFAPPKSNIGVTTGSVVKAADFDLDGKVDLAVVSYYDLEIFLGKGNGTFAEGVELALGSFSSISIGDLNGDGLPDLVLTGNFTGFAVFLNAGNGAFSAPRYFGNSQASGSLALGDFNGDGKLDVFQNGIFLGNGDGTFSNNPIPLPALDFGISYLQPEDFNRDGRLDMAVVAGNELLILYGRGDGTFDPGVIIGTGTFGAWQSTPIAAADFNSDGFPDLALITFPDGIAVFLSDGSGGFKSPVSYPEGPSPIVLLTADFDRDGQPDIAVANFYGSAIGVLSGNPDGTFETGAQIPTQAIALAAEDLNGDQKFDLVTGGTGISVWVGDGLGNFSAGYSNSAPSAVTSIAIADLNHDGHLDIVATTHDSSLLAMGELWVFLGDGTGNFIALSPVDLDFFPNSIALGSLDGNNFPDLVIAANVFNPGPGIHVYRGNGDGTFTPTITLGANAYTQVLLVDINKDGKLDLLGFHGAISVFLGDGLGNFQPAIENFANGSSMVVGDFNGDGKLDIVTNDHLSLLRGKGDGTFEPALWFSTAPTGYAIAALDFDRDGKLDLALAAGQYFPDGSTILLRGSGDGTFSESARYSADGGGLPIIVGDWNGDGKDDVAAGTGGGVRVLLNTNCTPRRLEISEETASCVQPGDVLSSLEVSAMDDGENVVSCALGLVAAAVVPGTGSPGATLGGTTVRPLDTGVAAFTDLSIDRAGLDYVLEFTSNGLVPARTRPISVQGSTVVSISGPSSICPGNVAVFSVGPGFDSYAWELDGVPSGTGRFFSATGLGVGPHTVTVTVDKAGCPGSATQQVSVGPPAPPAVSNNGPVCPKQTLQLTASTIPGAAYLWTGPNGFSSTQQNPQIASPSLAASGTYQVVATVAGCPSSSASTTVVVQNACPFDFFLVAPCRAIDTRSADGPALSASKKRTFDLSNRCGIPAGAKAVSINVTVTNPSASGFLIGFPGGTTTPGTSTISYSSGQTRANNAILPLGGKTDLAFFCSQRSGSTQLIVDVNGYFK